MANDKKSFQKLVWDHFATHKRDLPWRSPESDDSFDPYKILISEVMLQQTQVNRVIPKYLEFLEKFPSVEALATANLAEIIRVWSGLGYNRRAKYLHDTAKIIMKDHQGVFPQTLNVLTNFPGVGTNTAAAVLVYTYNQPLTFIETNIRTVYIHHFFADVAAVTDAQLLPIVADTLDHKRPREWYWALMDYGSHLKASSGNTARRSRHYTKQSAFHGSVRQLRGAILRLLATKEMSKVTIEQQLTDKRLPVALESLAKDGLIQTDGKHYRLAE